MCLSTFLYSDHDQVVKDSQAKKKKKFEFSNGGVHARNRARHSSSPPAVSRKESFTAEGVVTNIDDFIDDSRLPNRKKRLSDGIGREKGRFHNFRMRKRPHQVVEQTRSHDLLDTSERNETRELSPHHLSTEDRGRRSTSLPPTGQTGVLELRRQFESLSSSSPTPPVTPEDVVVVSSQYPKVSSGTGTGTETEAGTGARMGRRNSNGNSDSGRESMIMDSESIHPSV